MRIALIIPDGVDPSGRERVIPALLSLIKRLARRHEALAAGILALLGDQARRE